MNGIELSDRRPFEIVLNYWREQIVIEEDAKLFNPEYLEV
jgi:hypothetical protein